MTDRPTPDEILDDGMTVFRAADGMNAIRSKTGIEHVAALTAHDYRIVHPDDYPEMDLDFNEFGTMTLDRDLKVAICECLIDINDEVDPVTREKWGPIIPPTSIDWIGNKLVAAVLAHLETPS